MVAFTGLNSVKDRTIFVKKGPISKKPLPIITGNNLQVLSEVDIQIPTGTFTPAQVDYLIRIEGSPAGRNDGLFPIGKVLSSTKIRLKNTNFNVVDEDATVDNLVDLVNEIKSAYEFHRNQVVDFEGVLTQVHGTNDSIHIVTAPSASDFSSCITLVNDIRTQFEAHRIETSGDPQVHRNDDDTDVIYSPPATDLNSAILLANELKRKYENHRQEKFFHQTPDVVNKVNTDNVKAVTGIYPGPLTGPFMWTLLDPQYGKAANDPADVAVRVNGNPVVVDAVIGQLGAIVLENKPVFGDDVKIDYSYIKDPPQKFLRLNSEEFHLNQAGNNAVGGFSDHLYPGSSYLIDPSSPSPDFMAPSTPKRFGWKYKAFERAYSAVLNDPTTLLLNVPSNKISFTVLEEEQSELTIYYDPITLPNEFVSKWDKKGDGVITLDAVNKVLVINDEETNTGISENPPFYNQALPINSPSIVNSAFRARVLEEKLITDGVFTGVSFGISDGLHIANIGFIQSAAKNLSSAIYLANDLRKAFNAHFLADNVHDPDDTTNFIEFADAVDLPSLVNLSNVLASRYTAHIATGPLDVHQTADITNLLVAPAASNLSSSINLVNDIRVKFNAHLIQNDVHFFNDVSNNVGLVRQIGILKNTGTVEFEDNWESYAINWTVFVSYRVFRDSNGNFFVYLSGDINPIISVSSDDLPTISDLDFDVNKLQQVYFGSISRQAASISEWQFIRLTRTPVESVFIERNKSVEYDSTVIPPLDTSNPWITIGNGGFEYIAGGNLVVDSTAGASEQDVEEFGLSTGAFRGFTRLEPIQTTETTTSLEFEFATDFYTHSIDNQALGILVDDNCFSIQVAFLQLSPTAASTTGTISDPYTIVGGDELVLQVGNETPRIVSFADGDITAASAAAKINSFFGFEFAFDSNGKVRLTSEDLGSSATFGIISGNALTKLGLTPGKYIGTDSNPEPKISWFENFPDKNDPAWIVGGEQTSQLLSRTLRITDTSTLDFLTYSQTNPIVTNKAISAAHDWKLNFRFNMLSFIPGDILVGPFPYLDLNFAGLLVNVDEGVSGKNVEIHLSVNGGDTYINLVSYNSTTGNMEIMSQYAFDWSDGETHTISLFTNKSANQIRVYGDGQVLAPFVGPAPTYTGLKAGFAGPAITFGSGATGAANVDLATSQSVCDWEAVNIFRDSKINDPAASSRRYIGLYVSGPTDQLSSYLTYQIDWTLFHTYRIIRDPVSAVSIYVDGGNVPVITTSYDNLSLPLLTSSYLTSATGGRSNISFGAFNSEEISRTRWGFLKYSIGKLSRSELIIPPHNLLNQHNVIASGEHLRTKLPHNHLGTTVYSGGTPQDDFMANPDLEASTILNEGTPPVPMTQDLESRGGLIKTATLVDSVATEDFVDFRGDLANFSNDEFNIIGNFSIADLANDLKAKYNSHADSRIFHNNKDTTNIVVVANANSIVTAIILINGIKAKYNGHLVQVGVHTVNDVLNTIVTPDAVDLTTAITLANDISAKFGDHIISTTFHITFDTVNTIESPQITSALDSAMALANDIKAKYLDHTFQYNVHLENDTNNTSLTADATDLISAIELANSEKEQFNLHRVAIIGESQKVHISNDTVNIITYPDASDLESLTDLLINIKINYSAHLTQTNVHASTVFIIMDVPNRVLYDNIQFWKTEEGDGADISPFCDCLMFPEGSGFSNFSPPGFFFPGTELPEEFNLEQTIRLANNLKEMINLHFVEPGVHVLDDSFNTIISPDATTLGMLIILLNEIKAAFNAHLIQTGVHTADDPAESVITVNAVNLGTAQALANELRIKYEIHRRDAVLHLVADTFNPITELPTTNPSNPGWQLFTDGGTPDVVSLGNSVSVGTPNPMQAMYRYDGVVPRSPNINFEFAVSMKINSYQAPTGPDYDTRIYAGFTSDMNPGVAAAVGFEFVNGKPMVKLHDVNSDTPLARVHDPWPGQAFRTFRIVRDVKTDTFQLFFEPGDGIFDDTFDDTFN